MEEEGRKGSEINQARQAAEGKFTLLCGRQWLGWLNGAEGSSAEMEWKQLRPAEWPKRKEATNKWMKLMLNEFVLLNGAVCAANLHFINKKEIQFN